MMEKQLNWGLKLSLQQMALRTVTANVWNNSDILASIERCRFKSLSKDSIDIWRETVENDVKDKISKLLLPASLKKQMIHLVRPMGLHIQKWKISHELILCGSYEYFDMPILEQLCWTCVGAIDYQNTAERLVRSKILNIVNSYKLACLYCLVDYIADLWEQLPECDKNIVLNGGQSLEEDLDLYRYWAFYSNPNHVFAPSWLRLPYQYDFTSAAFRGNKAATEYFHQLIPYENRDFHAFDAINYILYIKPENRLSDFPMGDVFSYLFFQMMPEERLEFLKKYPCDVLKYFLDWPWQDLFLEIADVIWTFLPESSYGYFISIINADVRDSSCYSPNFIEEIFLRSPRNFKKHFVCRFECLFTEFFNAEDTETIKIVFRNLDLEYRVRMISSYKFFYFLNGFIMTDKWHMVELCLREAILSKEEIKRLKEVFMGFLTGNDSRSMRSRKRNWRRLFQFLDGSDKSFRKRSHEGEMLTKAKRTLH